MTCESCLSSGDERGEFWSFCPGRTVKRRMEWKLPWRRAEATKKVWHMSPSPLTASRCQVYASSPAGLHATGGHVFVYWDRVVVVGSLRSSTDSNPFLFASCVFFCILWNLLLRRCIQRSVSGSHIAISCFSVPS